MTSTTVTSEYALISVDHVHPHPRNVRRTVTGVDDLADSIRSGGLHQPLVVAPVDSGSTSAGYTLVMGHRRHAAVQSLGWAEVPCIIRHDLDTDAAVLEAMLAENIARADLTVTEEGDAVQALLDLDVQPTKIARAIGRTSKHVKDRAQIAGLADKAREAVDDGQISITDALHLSKLDDDHELATKVEASIGTPGFRYELERALQQTSFNRKRDDVLAELAEAGATITDGPAQQADDEVRIFLAARPDDVTAPGTSVYVSEWQPWSGGAAPRVQWVQIRPREDEDPDDGADLVHREEGADDDDAAAAAAAEAENAAIEAAHQERVRAANEERAARKTAQDTRHRWLHEKWREGMHAGPGVRDAQLRDLVSDTGGYSSVPDAADLSPIIGGPGAGVDADSPELDPAGWSQDRLIFAAWWIHFAQERDHEATGPAQWWDDDTVAYLHRLADDYDYPLSDVETGLINTYLEYHSDPDGH